MQVEKFQVNIEQSQINGFIHYPDNHSLSADTPLPVVIMGNGYATEWQFGTMAYVQALTDAGIASVNFDYRGFGVSENQYNQPRQIVDIPAQLNDWRAVIAFIQKQKWVNAEKVILWGSSLGGGHALSMASETPNICATVAQVPHCDSRAAFKTVALKNVFKGMGYAITDSLRALLKMQPLLIPVLGEPENYAVMNHPGWLKEYKKISAGSKTWNNQIPARSLLRGGDYRPILSADKIQCPTLLVAGLNDAGVPFDAVKETAAKIRDARVFSFDGDHFDVYHGPRLADIVKEELTFIQQQINR
jgi:pimeloyl-ACP methyl ester carboxylesterase